MSNSIQSANEDFPFSNLTLANPQGLQGGAYFSKLRISGETVLIQTPKCSTKNGIHKTEKKIYCDLLFTNDDEDFIKWIQTLETIVKNLIYEKRDLWFHNDMDHDSIDYHWQNLLRTYKGNKSLLRCFFSKPKGLNRSRLVQIYNEEEETLTIDDVTNTSQMISILEISGLKFTSQSFQIEFVIKQMMLIKNKPLFSKCLIKINTPPKQDAVDSNTIVAPHDSDAESDISIEDIQDTTDKLIDPSIKDNKTEENTNQLVEETSNIKDMSENNVTLEIVDENVVVDEEIETKKKNNEEDNQEKVEVDLSKNEIQKMEENLEKMEKTTEQSVAQEESLDKYDIMNEIEILTPSETTDSVTLKKPNEVYMEIYKEARRKAKEAKKNAIQSYLEAKRIKSLYLLDEIESSDDDLEFGEYAE